MSVYANSREVSGKAQPNQIIAGFPSVCLSPPSPPAGPIPIPYPMFTNAKKTSGGTRSVKIKKKEVGKKNTSTYKKSNGNEPATRSFGMDVVTHTLSNATKHLAWSFTVMAEGKNVHRMGDMNTTNHNNPATALTVNVAGANPALILGAENQCKALGKQNKSARTSMKRNKNKEVKKAGKESTTITHSLFEPTGGGQAEIARASSRQIITRDKTWAKGVTVPEGTELKRPLTAADEASGNYGDKKAGDEVYKNVPLDSDVCGGGFTYAEANPGRRPHTSHTESRILEKLYSDHGPSTDGEKLGTVTMNIDWQSQEPTGEVYKRGKRKGKKKMQKLNQKVPCKHCHKLLCHATQCFEIKVCNEEGEAEDYSEKCDVV